MLSFTFLAIKHWIVRVVKNTVWGVRMSYERVHGKGMGSPMMVVLRYLKFLTPWFNNFGKAFKGHCPIMGGMGDIGEASHAGTKQNM